MNEAKGCTFSSVWCVWCRPCLALNHKLVLHSCPLIYAGRIKRHGLYRSTVAFLYSHRHSWGTAGWSRKRFMAPTHTGAYSSKRCCHLLLSIASLTSSPPTKTRGERDEPANPTHLPKHSIISHWVKVFSCSCWLEKWQRGHHWHLVAAYCKVLQ